MKFCPNCGRPLNDDEVCTCQSQRQPIADDARTVAATPQPQPQRTVAPQPQPAAPQPVAPQAYPNYQAQPKQPAAEGKFVKTLKNIPLVFKNYWTGSDTLVDTAKKSKDWLLSVMFICILFFVNLILGICYFARMCDSTFHYHNGLGMFAGTFAASAPFKFGFVLLGALIITVFASCLYISFRFFSSLILSKKNPADAFMDGLVEFGIHSMPVILWLFLGALLSLATCWLTVAFVGTAMAYYVVIGVSNTLKECGETKNVFLRNIVITAFVMLGVILTVWMFHLICQMNAGGAASVSSAMNAYESLSMLGL